MLGINFIITILFDKVIFSMLDWFNQKSTFIKIILLILGIGGFLSLTLNLTGVVTNIITAYLLKVFPQNLFTVISGFLIAAANSVNCIIQLWNAIPFWDFWFIIEFIILSGFIISISFILLPFKIEKK